MNDRSKIYGGKCDNGTRDYVTHVYSRLTFIASKSRQRENGKVNRTDNDTAISDFYIRDDVFHDTVDIASRSSYIIEEREKRR